MKKEKGNSGTYSAIPVFAFALTALALSLIQIKVNSPILLAERFYLGAGWVEIFFLSIYAGIIAFLFTDSKKSAKIRPNIWAFFSFVFFAQLILGLAGAKTFLMTGQLHLPIPALIIAGPLFRGSGFFMITLFFVTVLVLGPAWCSHLCYIGAWDDAASRAVSRPKKMPSWIKIFQFLIMLIVFSFALLLGLSSASVAVAGISAVGFGLAGLAIMLFVSSRTGVMVHCTSWCPIGWVATCFGKINPFRIRISSECDACGSCATACRYNALSEADIEKKRAGTSCTLCGDCVHKCAKSQINYRFGRMKPERARALFILLVVSFHAVFLGVARI